MNIIELSQTFDKSEQDIIELMQAEKGWENKYRRLMLLGKGLQPLPVELMTDDYRVDGCESNVWLATQWQEQHLCLAAYSDAKIVRGLVCVVLAAFNGKTKPQIDEFDVDAYFDELQLLGQLSPSRGNGLRAIVDKIKSID